MVVGIIHVRGIQIQKRARGIFKMLECVIRDFHVFDFIAYFVYSIFFHSRTPGILSHWRIESVGTVKAYLTAESVLGQIEKSAGSGQTLVQCLVSGFYEIFGGGLLPVYVVLSDQTLRFISYVPHKVRQYGVVIVVGNAAGPKPKAAVYCKRPTSAKGIDYLFCSSTVRNQILEDVGKAGLVTYVWYQVVRVTAVAYLV